MSRMFGFDGGERGFHPNEVLQIRTDEQHRQDVSVFRMLDPGSVGSIPEAGELRLEVRIAVHEIGSLSDVQE